MGIFKGIDKALDFANEVRDDVKYLDDKRKYYLSGKFKNDRQFVEKLQKQTTSILRFTLLMWIILILATITLCVIGNDVILRFLNL